MMVAPANNTVTCSVHAKTEEMKRVLTNLCSPLVVSPNVEPACLQSDILEYTCLYLCRDYRRQVARKVHVVEETPRTLWCRAESTSTCGDGVGKGGTRIPRDTGSASKGAAMGGHRAEPLDDRLISSRVPLARVIIIVCMLPAAKLATGGFRWLDGVKEIHFHDCVENIDNTYLDDPFSEDDSSDDSASEVLEVVSFQECFDGPLDSGCVPLPPGLKIIHFGVNWNVELHGTRGGFPDSLESICFPRHFNQPLTGGGVGLPQGLREILLGRDFNQSLIGVDWPKGLETLQFGKRFDQALAAPGANGGGLLGPSHALPGGLKNLYLGHAFDRSLSGCELPNGLEELVIGDSFDFTAEPVRWPSGLKRLYIGSQSLYAHDLALVALPMELPPKLELLCLVDYFDSPLPMVAWPLTLKVLDLGNAFDHPIGETGNVPLLPDGLVELRLGSSFNHSIENIRLPEGLKRLTFVHDSSTFDHGLAGVMWPPGLEALTLGNAFNQPMEGTTFPETLRELSFGEAFSFSLQGVTLPDGLACLTFAWTYRASLLVGLDWPRSLRSLCLGGARASCPDEIANLAW